VAAEFSVASVAVVRLAAAAAVASSTWLCNSYLD
jgi:hypothetical protein